MYKPPREDVAFCPNDSFVKKRVAIWSGIGRSKNAERFFDLRLPAVAHAPHAPHAPPRGRGARATTKIVRSRSRLSELSRKPSQKPPGTKDTVSKVRRVDTIDPSTFSNDDDWLCASGTAIKPHTMAALSERGLSAAQVSFTSELEKEDGGGDRITSVFEKPLPDAGTEGIFSETLVGNGEEEARGSVSQASSDGLDNVVRSSDYCKQVDLPASSISVAKETVLANSSENNNAEKQNKSTAVSVISSPPDHKESHEKDPELLSVQLNEEGSVDRKCLADKESALNSIEKGNYFLTLSNGEEEKEEEEEEKLHDSETRDGNEEGDVKEKSGQDVAASAANMLVEDCAAKMSSTTPVETEDSSENLEKHAPVYKSAPSEDISPMPSFEPRDALTKGEENLSENLDMPKLNAVSVEDVHSSEVETVYGIRLDQCVKKLLHRIFLELELEQWLPTGIQAEETTTYFITERNQNDDDVDDDDVDDDDDDVDNYAAAAAAASEKEDEKDTVSGNLPAS